jgi:hypothetical protein
MRRENEFYLDDTHRTTFSNALETEWNSTKSVLFHPHMLEIEWNSTRSISYNQIM